MDDSQKLIWYEKTYGPIIEQRGLQNWKNLFRKPTTMEWIVLFMLIMMLFVAWAYQKDIQTCWDFVKTVNENPCKINQIINYSSPQLNFSLLTFKEETKEASG